MRLIGIARARSAFVCGALSVAAAVSFSACEQEAKVKGQLILTFQTDMEVPVVPNHGCTLCSHERSLPP